MDMDMDTDSIKQKILQITGLSDRHPGLSPAVSESHTEAARVCLSRHHESPTNFSIKEKEKELSVVTNWEHVSERIKAAWANEIDTTENGAYACVLAAVEVCKNMVAVRRAETLTGADYYVAPLEAPLDDMENYYRLEISGSDKSSKGAIYSLLKRKLEQAESGDSNLPAMAGVIGFREKLILLEELEQK